MILKQITLVNFKSYAKSTFDFSDKLNVIHGLNGVGKTNLLDAIYCLSMTKSNFGLTDGLLIKEGEDFYRVEGKFQVEEEVHKLVLKCRKRKKKVLEHNGVAYEKLSEHIGFLPLVIIAPDDIELINGSNEIRRRFINHTLSQIDREYLASLMLYNRLLKQRNALLKSYHEGRKYDSDLIFTYDVKMSPPAQYIYEARKAFFEQFNGIFSRVYKQLANEKEEVESIFSADQDNATFLDLQKKNKDRDRALGRTTTGPHRDKVALSVLGRPAKNFASQGQKKSLVFAIKLAQYEMIARSKDQLPMLLLDDIFDRLDSTRVERLLQHVLKRTFGQVFITDTEVNRIAHFLGEETETCTMEIL